MITRRGHITGGPATFETHREIRQAIPIEELRSALAEDRYLNGISLRRWDSIALSQMPYDRDLLTAAGDYATLGGLVCIAKEAARQLVEEL